MTRPLLQRDMAMGSIFQHPRWRNLVAAAKSMSLVPYLFIAVLMTLLMWTVFVSDSGWRPAGDVDLPDAGYLAMTFGLMFSLVVGSGVMTLVFYDETARLPPPDGDFAPETTIRRR